METNSYYVVPSYQARKVKVFGKRLETPSLRPHSKSSHHPAGRIHVQTRVLPGLGLAGAHCVVGRNVLVVVIEPVLDPPARGGRATPQQPVDFGRDLLRDGRRRRRRSRPRRWSRPRRRRRRSWSRWRGSERRLRSVAGGLRHVDGSLARGWSRLRRPPRPRRHASGSRSRGCRSRLQSRWLGCGSHPRSRRGREHRRSRRRTGCRALLFQLRLRGL